MKELFILNGGTFRKAAFFRRQPAWFLQWNKVSAAVQFLESLKELFNRGGPYSWCLYGPVKKAFDSAEHSIMNENLKLQRIV